MVTATMVTKAIMVTKSRKATKSTESTEATKCTKCLSQNNHVIQDFVGQAPCLRRPLRPPFPFPKSTTSRQRKTEGRLTVHRGTRSS